MGVFDFLSTGKSAAKRAQGIANDLSKQGVDLQKQGLAFEMAKYEQQEPARLQQIFNQTQAGAGASGLMNQLFQKPILNPEIQMQQQTGGFQGLGGGGGIFGQPARPSQPPMTPAQPPGVAPMGAAPPPSTGTARTTRIQGQEATPIDSSSIKHPKTNQPISVLDPRVKMDPINGTFYFSEEGHEAPQQPISGDGAGAAIVNQQKVDPIYLDEGTKENFPLFTGATEQIASLQQDGLDGADAAGRPPYTLPPVIPAGGQSHGIPQAQGPNAELAKQLHGAFAPGGEFSQQLQTPDLVGEQQVHMPGVVGRDQFGFNYGNKVQGQEIQGPEQVQGRMTSLPGLVGTGRDVVDRARTAAQDPFESLIRGRRRDAGASNQFGGGQVQAATQGAKFLQAQAGSKAASGAQQMLEDRLYGQQIGDREQRKQELLGIEGLRREQGLGDRERVAGERLGIEGLRRGQEQSDRQLFQQLGLTDRESTRQQEIENQRIALDQKLQQQGVTQQQQLSDRDRQIADQLSQRDLAQSQAIGGLEFSLNQSAQERDMLQRLGIAERDKPMQQFSQLMALLNGMPAQNANPAGMAIQAGGNIGNIGANLGANASSAMQAANQRFGQMVGMGMNAAGAGGAFGGNIQGMFTGGGGAGMGGGGNVSYWDQLKGY
jgi:hypothetical protein